MSVGKELRFELVFASLSVMSFCCGAAVINNWPEIRERMKKPAKVAEIPQGLHSFPTSTPEKDILPTPFPTITPEVHRLSDPVSNSVEEIEKQGYDCEPFPKGSWPLKELGKRGKPGIDPGPYRIVHKDGTIQYFKDINELPNLVFPNEEFCIPDDIPDSEEPTSFKINPLEKRGLVFQAPVRSSNSQLARNAVNIQAGVRT